VSDQPRPVEVGITANVKGLVDGFDKGAEHVESAVAGMKGDLGSLSDALGNMSVSMVAGLAVVGLAIEGVHEGLEFVKDSVKETLELAESYHKLSYETGLTYDELNAADAAFKMIGGSVNQLEGWVRSSTRAIKANADQLVEQGLATSKAELLSLPFEEYLKRVAQRADEFTSAGERNQFMQLAMGRAGVAAGAEIKRFVDNLEAGKAAADEFGVKIGEDAVEGMEEFQRAEGRLGTDNQALKVAVGEQLLPVLTEFVTFLADNMKPTIDFARTSTAGLRLAIAHLTHDWSMLTTVMDVSARVLKGDISFKEADAIATRKLEEENAKLALTYSDVVTSLSKASAAGGAGPKGSDHFVPKDKKGPDEELAALKIEFEKRKAAEEEVHTWSLAKEAEFWSAKLDVVTKGSKSESYAWEQLNKTKKEMRVKQDAEDKAEFEEQLKDAQHDADWRVAIAMQEAERVKAVKGAQSAEYVKALGKVREEEQKQNDELRKIWEVRQQMERDAELAELELRTEDIKTAKQLYGKSDAEELIALQELEEKKYQIMLAASREQAALELDPVKHQEKLSAIEKLEQQHTLKMTQMNDQLVLAQQSKWKGYLDSVTSGWASMFVSMSNAGKSWSEKWAAIMKDAAGKFEEMVLQMALDWVRAEVIKLASSKATAAATVSGNAAEAGSAAMASAAQDGPYGWMIAIGAGLAVYGAAKGLLNSAAGGWDNVPSDQLAMIHKNEMVLPASLAQSVRQAAAGGSMGGGNMTNHFYIQAMDARSFEGFLHQNTGAVVRVGASAARSFERGRR